MGTMITMLAPDGSSGEVPIDKLEAAKSAGFKVGIHMKSPDGKDGYIPADKVHDAAASGFKMVPLDVPEGAKASYWDALTNPVGAGYRDQGVLGGALQVGGQAIKAAVAPVMHPIETVKGMAKMAAAAGSGNPLTLGQEMLAPAVQNYMADKANGGHALALENLAGQAIGTTEGGRMMGAATGGSPKSAPGAVSRTLNSTAEKMYGTAMKPATTLSAADRTAMVRTGLDNALPVSPAGMEKLGGLIDDLNQKIKGVIDTDPNRPIDPNAVSTRADIAKARFTNQVNATKDLNAIESSRQQFLREQGAPVDAQGNISGPAPDMPASKAQAMKQGTYSVLRDKYGEQGAASVEAQKNLAMGLKEELATQFPELSTLNAAESKLLDLGPVLERAVNRVSNNHTIGIGGPILGSAIKAGTGSSGAAAAVGVLKSVVDIPMVKSRLAIALSKAAKIPYPQAAARVSAYSASLGSAVHGSPAYSSDDTPSQ